MVQHLKEREDLAPDAPLGYYYQQKHYDLEGRDLAGHDALTSLAERYIDADNIVKKSAHKERSAEMGDEATADAPLGNYYEHKNYKTTEESN